jgi:antirestriction protein ArdC
MSRNLQKEITSRILAALKNGVAPWRRPWSEKASSEGAMPRNAISGRAYSGANVILLWATAQERGYSSPRWLTFKQALEAGGNVRKGEKGTTVIYVSHFEKDGDDGEARRIPFLKAFTVFNVAQCDGLDLEAAKPRAPRNEEARDALADEFLASTGADIRHGEGRAYYRPAGDFVMLPDFAAFDSASAYYAVAFHELGHWTGAEARLNRQFGKRFGDRAYSTEELVAELTSAFLCAEFGFDNDGQDAAYIETWISLFESHEGALIAAAAAASKAVEFMRDKALADALPLAA